jgi:hypothetical protein
VLGGGGTGAGHQFNSNFTILISFEIHHQGQEPWRENGEKGRVDGV